MIWDEMRWDSEKLDCDYVCLLYSVNIGVQVCHKTSDPQIQTIFDQLPFREWILNTCIPKKKHKPNTTWLAGKGMKTWTALIVGFKPFLLTSHPQIWWNEKKKWNTTPHNFPDYDFGSNVKTLIPMSKHSHHVWCQFLSISQAVSHFCCQDTA